MKTRRENGKGEIPQREDKIAKKGVLKI